MQIPVDTELVTAGVYFVVVPLYGLLWYRHVRHAYAALAIAAIILALCALLRSETVRAWGPHPSPRHHEIAPTTPSVPENGFSTFDRVLMAGTSSLQQGTLHYRVNSPTFAGS